MVADYRMSDLAGIQFALNRTFNFKIGFERLKNSEIKGIHQKTKKEWIHGIRKKRITNKHFRNCSYSRKALIILKMSK